MSTRKLATTLKQKQRNTRCRTKYISPGWYLNLTW